MCVCVEGRGGEGRGGGGGGGNGTHSVLKASLTIVLLPVEVLLKLSALLMFCWTHS